MLRNVCHRFLWSWWKLGAGRFCWKDRCTHTQKLSVKSWYEPVLFLFLFASAALACKNSRTCFKWPPKGPPTRSCCRQVVAMERWIIQCEREKSFVGDPFWMVVIGGWSLSRGGYKGRLDCIVCNYRLQLQLSSTIFPIRKNASFLLFKNYVWQETIS